MENYALELLLRLYCGVTVAQPVKPFRFRNMKDLEGAQVFPEPPALDVEIQSPCVGSLLLYAFPTSKRWKEFLVFNKQTVFLCDPFIG